MAPPVTDVDLLAVARRVAGDARPGEQIEAYVLRSRDTDVEVFGGEVESLTVAEIEGVGVRVIADARQGYAWAGSLDDDVIAETLAEARDNAGFGSPDESYVLASPSDVAGALARRSSLDLWRDDVLSTSTADKVALALELEAAVRAADPLVRGVESASYGDAAVEAAVANSLGVEASDAAHLRSCSAFAMAGEDTLTQTGSGFSVGRSFAEVDLHEAARDAAERAVRLLGAKPIPSGRLPIVFDPLVTRSLLALLGGALVGRGDREGPLVVRRSRGRGGGGPGDHAGRRPDARRGVRGGDARRRGCAHAADRAHRRRSLRRGAAQRAHREARRWRRAHDRFRGARRVQVAAGRRARERCTSSRARSAPRRSWPRSTTASTCSR